MTSLGTQTFQQMVATVGRCLNDPSEPRKVAIKDALNSWYLFAAENRSWDQLIEADESGLRSYSDSTVKTFVSGDAFTPAPWNAMRVKSLLFQDVSAQEIQIVETSELYERAGSMLNTPGAPLYAAVAGRTAQWKALSADGFVTFTSTDVNDGAVVRVHYRRSAGHVGIPAYEDLTCGDWQVGLNCVTQLRAGWPIERVSLPEGWVGDLNGAEGSTNILSVQRPHQPPAVSDSSYQIADRLLLRLWPVPDSDYPMTVIFQRIPTRLSEDADQPVIPVSDFMVYKATATLKRLQGDLAGAANFEAEASAAWSGSSQSGTPRGSVTMKPAGGNLLGMTGTSNWRP